jgi:hypothetical protein
MGIKYLNRFLKENAYNGMKFISIADLSGKKIAVDISIYMYKYASEDALIENMYLMLSIFRHNNVIPVFIFDGKSPVEKKELLQKRWHDKKQSEKEYNDLQNMLKSERNIDDAERQEIIYNMDMLKKSFIHIEKSDIENVKSLIRAYGATYYDAPGEADELCAYLTIKEKVWACLSEDMDMFVYGCPRVLRYFSLINHTAVLYDVPNILEILGVTQKELREICILSGTDYNKANNDLYKTLKYFKKYHRDKSNSDLKFYPWLLEKTDYIQDYDLLLKITSMFELQNEDDNDNQNVNKKCNNFKNVSIENGPIKKIEMNEILKKEGFIFPPL